MLMTMLGAACDTGDNEPPDDDDAQDAQDDGTRSGGGSPGRRDAAVVGEDPPPVDTAPDAGGDSGTRMGSASGSGSFTLLVYMVGSDLESKNSFGTSDLAEMQKVGSTANLNVVVETGGADKPGWRTVKRWSIQKGARKELSDLGDLSMAAPKTLQDFVSWGMSTYPAERYGLVLWDHGGGAVGPTSGPTFGFDENHGGAALSLMEIKQAVKDAAGGKKLELLGFDACLMATLETAHVLSGLANYLVASEETEPGFGWDYEQILSALASDPQVKGDVLGKKIADSYLAFAKAVDVGSDTKTAQSLTLSVVDLAKVPALVTSLEAFVGKAGGELKSMGRVGWTKLADGRSKAEEFGNDESDQRYTDLTDVKDLAKQLAKVYPSETASLQAAVEAAVSYSIRGNAHEHANGLSIYLAYRELNSGNLTKKLEAYQALDFSPVYKQFLQDFASQGNADDSAPTFAGAAYSSGELSAQVGGGDTAEVTAVITLSDPDTGSVLILGTDSADIDAAGHASYTFDGELLALNDSYVFTVVEDEDDDSVVFAVPALLNDEAVDIRFLFDKATEEVVLMGAFPGYVDGVIERDILEISEGDVIAPLFPRYDLATDDFLYVTFMQFTVDSDGLFFSTKPLPTGTYQLALTAEDYAQNQETSEFFEVEVTASGSAAGN